MHYTIYKTTNKINGKYYIGKHQTQNLDDDYLGSGKLLIAAIKKYGIENFTKEILFVFDNEDEMNSKEKELVTEDLIDTKQTYNLCPGGKGGFNYINKHKLADTKKGRINANRVIYEKYGVINPGQIEKNKILARNRMLQRRKNGWKHTPPSFKDKKHSKETKDQISKILKEKKHQQGEKNSQFGTCWIHNNIINKKIKKDELNVWLEKGFIKGYKMNLNKN